jgi:hypothetical protein
MIKSSVPLYKSLATKGGWKFLTNHGLLQNLLIKKKKSPLNIEEYIRQASKSSKDGSMFWKENISSLHIIRLLGWKIKGGS